jgi:hypothetical protein
LGQASLSAYGVKPVRDGLDDSPAETDKASAADRFGDDPTFSNNQNYPLNKTRTYLFSKREFGMVFLQTKPFPGEDHATSAGSPQSRWQPVFQFP